MKTKTSHSNIKGIAAVIGLIAASVFIACIVLHTNPFILADSIIDFAIHHYFLMGFISLIVTLFCLKVYYTIDDKLETAYISKQSIGITRIAKRTKKTQVLRELLSFKLYNTKSKLIDKTGIHHLKFAKEDVLKTEIDVSNRLEELSRAMKLGNSEKHKVKIFFKDRYSNKHVETTIWNLDPKHVTLKGGITIPVSSILKIEF